MERIETSQLTCLEAPYLLDLDVLLCQDDLVDTYQWYLDGSPITNSNAAEVKSLLITKAGKHKIRVEATTAKDGCGPFFLEKEIEVTEGPVLDVEFQVDSAALCSPVVTIATITTAAHVSSFKWTSDSPDVTFSDPKAATPLITVDNRQGGTRVITLTANSDACGTVQESFTLTTYNDQEFNVIGSPSTCVSETFEVCDFISEPLTVETITWSDTDETTIFKNGNRSCPVVNFATAGVHTLRAEGTDVCGQPFAYSMTVRVRDNLPLSIQFNELDTICDQEPPLDLSDYIKPFRNVAAISGPGVVGKRFDPSGLYGKVNLSVTDSCGALYPVPVFVLREGGFTGINPVLCLGETLDLTTLQPGTYTGEGVTDNVFNSDELEAGSYQISFVSDAYCGGAGSFNLTLQNPPHADFSIATPSCVGGEAGTIFRAGQPIQVVNLSTSQVLCYTVEETGQRQCDTNAADFTISSPGTYTIQQVVGSRGTDCTDTLRRQIEVRSAFNPNFSYEILEDGCDSVSITLSSGGLPEAVVPGWTLSTGKVLKAKSHTIRVARPRNEQWMTVAVTASNGCFKYQDTFNLEVPRRFQVGFGILNDNRTVCSGDTVLLKNNSFNAERLTVTYPDGKTSTTLPGHLILSNPGDKIMAYPITMTGMNSSCGVETATDTVFVLPTTTRAGFNLVYADNCAVREVSLVNLSTSGSRGRVFWGDGSTPQWTVAGDTLRHRYNVNRDTTFTISLEATLCGTHTYQTDFRVRAAPNATFTVQTPQSSCVGDSLVFVPNIAGGAEGFDWDFGDGNFSQHHRPTHVYDRPGQYPVILEVTTTSGCVTSDTVMVTVDTYNGKNLSAAIPEETCVGGDFTVDVGSPGTGLSYSYGAGTQTAGAMSRPFQTVGVHPFTLTATDAQGCQIDTTVLVTVHPKLSVKIEPDRRDTTLDLGNSLDLTFSVSPQRSLDSISWFGEGIDDPLNKKVLAMPTTDNLYRLQVMDEFGCRAADSLMVRIRTDYRDRIYTPNVFTPNGDGYNESFALFIKPNTVRAIESLKVISRWGTVVYECSNCGTDDLAHGWDGNIGGNPAKTGVYIWAAKVEFVDGTEETFTGDVTLLR
ncbi:PKD domain-containing protein [Neolewinella litorea]|uniref:PKD domain-containing protein n=1 Tax=Neolewinella litorea TaxID=2562452 RepID=UPI001455FEFE|nr:PKD domain-containing protein [Neolewinella litorea]